MQTLNPFEAAILAGYPRDEAIRYGNTLLGCKRVVAEIRDKVDKYAQNLYITKSYIIQKLVDIIEFSVQKEPVMNKDGTFGDNYKLKDASNALKALISLAKLVEGCEKMGQNTDTDVNVENLNIENI